MSRLATTSVPKKTKQAISAPTANRIRPEVERRARAIIGTYDVIITLEPPWNTATLFVTAPITISANASQATLGVAMRQRSSVDEQK